jgi:hypothetical protein
MLKTTIHKPAQPFIPAILLGVLKGYLKHPLLFMIQTAVKFKSFQKKITLDLPKEFINTAAFSAFMYLELQKRLSKNTAYEIIRVALLTNALVLQQANFRTVEAERTFENLKKFQKRTNNEGITRLNTMEILEDNASRYTFRITRCLFHELFSNLRVPELTCIMCAVDNAIFSCYLPNEIVFRREKGLTICEGADACQFEIINNRS